MLEKASLGNELESFKAFMQKATGLKWNRPYRLATFNLKQMMELAGGNNDGKKGRKKK
jgi:hypothetical protein